VVNAGDGRAGGFTVIPGGYLGLMPTFRHTARAGIPADHLFAFLSDPRHLPYYFPQMIVAEPEGDGLVRVEADVQGGRVEGKAWLHSDEINRTLFWGTENEANYHGELHIGDGLDAGSCEITVVLYTELTDGDEVRRAIEETVARIARTASAESEIGDGSVPA
jgi:hypothetical protein